MEYGSRLRFALLVVGGILLLVLSIWGVTSLAHRLFGNSPTKTNESTVKKTDLAEFNKPSSFVRLTIEGPIVASEKYESFQIEVGQNYRELKVFKGYDREVASERRYSNDGTAYETFLKALKRTNYTLKDSDTNDSETGYCATGRRYVYQLFDNGEEVMRTWNTSCNADQGTFSGNGTNARSLFKKQIPDYADLTKGLSIN